MLLVGIVTGCQKKEQQLDFEHIVSIKVLTNEKEKVSIFEKEKVQNMLQQLQDITWERRAEESVEEDDDWKYRIICYDSKGQKKNNIILCNENRIMYKNAFWDAEEGALDLSEYDALFQEE